MLHQGLRLPRRQQWPSYHQLHLRWSDNIAKESSPLQRLVLHNEFLWHCTGTMTQA